jgi:hypothetical protein
VDFARPEKAESAPAADGKAEIGGNRDEAQAQSFYC